MAAGRNYWELFDDSFERERERVTELPAKGIPIGNLTSQIFANIYMNEFDQFVKHTLKVKNYARYTDDFVVIANHVAYLEQLLPSIQEFLATRLQLTLHPHKVSIQSSHRGVDFLGYIIFPHHRLIRTKTRRRMMKRIAQRLAAYVDGDYGEYSLSQTIQSYLGVLSHADTHTLRTNLKNHLGFWVKSWQKVL